MRSSETSPVLYLHYTFSLRLSLSVFHLLFVFLCLSILFDHGPPSSSTLGGFQIGLVRKVGAQESQAVCAPGNEWMENSKGQSPCDIVAQILFTCQNTNFSTPPSSSSQSSSSPTPPLPPLSSSTILPVVPTTSKNALPPSPPGQNVIPSRQVTPLLPLSSKYLGSSSTLSKVGIFYSYQKPAPLVSIYLPSQATSVRAPTSSTIPPPPPPIPPSPAPGTSPSSSQPAAPVSQNLPTLLLHPTPSLAPRQVPKNSSTSSLRPYILPALPAGNFAYPGPVSTSSSDFGSNTCLCSEPVWSLLAACATCQGAKFVNFTQHTQSCNFTFLGNDLGAQKDLPIREEDEEKIVGNGIRIPSYAVFDWVGNSSFKGAFDLMKAMQLAVRDQSFPSSVSFGLPEATSSTLAIVSSNSASGSGTISDGANSDATIVPIPSSTSTSASGSGSANDNDNSEENGNGVVSTSVDQQANQPTSPAINNASFPTSRSNNHTGIIVGGVIGGLAIIGLTGLGLFYIWIKSRGGNASKRRMNWFGFNSDRTFFGVRNAFGKDRGGNEGLERIATQESYSTYQPSSDTGGGDGSGRVVVSRLEAEAASLEARIPITGGMRQIQNTNQYPSIHQPPPVASSPSPRGGPPRLPHVRTGGGLSISKYPFRPDQMQSQNPPVGNNNNKGFYGSAIMPSARVKNHMGSESKNAPAADGSKNENENDPFGDSAAILSIQGVNRHPGQAL